MNFGKLLCFYCLFLLSPTLYAQGPLKIPEWTEGNLDVVVFKTGRGDAIFTIMVDRAYKATGTHIWLQVKPDGRYHIHTLETSNGRLVIKDTFGPYQSSEK